MTRLLLRAGARHHLRHRWQLALSIIGIALGVAVVVAVDLATSSARRGFEISAETVSGRATHEIIGGPAGLPESVYTRLRVQLGIDSIAPVIDRTVRLPQHGRRSVRMLGIDPFAERPFRSYAPRNDGAVDFGSLLTGRAVLLDANTAAGLGLAPGDSLVIWNGGRYATVTLAGFISSGDSVQGSISDIMLTDIATAQEITGAFGVVDRIDLRLSGDSADAILQRLRLGLPPGVRILESSQRTAATTGLTRAFDINITALALIALVFGMFLIYNSVTFSVVQRRPLIGLLRAQGVTGGEVMTLLLAESFLIGLVATVIGVALGIVLGSGLVRLVARTINDLYFALSVTSITITGTTLVKAVALGIGATLAAAFPAAREAVRSRPRTAMARSTLERNARAAATRLTVGGAVAAIASVIMLMVPSRSVVVGFAALFVLILAFALSIPAATLLLMRALRPVVALLGATGGMAARGVSASLSRTAPAIAALSIALGVGIAVAIMVGSFREGVVTWLGRSLQADLYLSAPDFGATRMNTSLDTQLPDAIQRIDGVAGVSRYRHTNLLVDGAFVTLIAIDMYGPQRELFQLLESHDSAWSAFDKGAILVSEPLSYRRGLAPGARLTLPTDSGNAEFAVAAVYRDYASEHGVIFMSRAVYDRFWPGDSAITSLAVFLGPGGRQDSVTARIRALPEARSARIQANRTLRDATLVVFDRTFAITGVLRLLSLLVAFVGVTGALMALQLERYKEIGVLRTIGMTPSQVGVLVMLQTALMGLASAILAAPLGLAMSWAMVHVINRRSFGWSFDMVITAGPFAQALLVGLTAAVLAGIYPAIRMSRIRPAYALREE